MLTVIMGGYFNIFITFPNVSIMYPILVYCGMLLWPLLAKTFLNEESLVSNCACHICEYYIIVTLVYRLVLFI